MHTAAARGAGPRIIPTGVGKRKDSQGLLQKGADHPHGCGEKPYSMISSSPLSGSSPRVWGKVYKKVHALLAGRIIPTGVGKSVGLSPLDSTVPDHPHGCGEKVVITIPNIDPVGSSPRVWGKEWLDLGRLEYFRIIPTGVGKSLRPPLMFMYRPDHPHGCGEKIANVVVSLLTSGSSPRVWGKESICEEIDVTSRIIPTGVGKSINESRRDSINADHPHGCGEK